MKRRKAAEDQQPPELPPLRPRSDLPTMHEEYPDECYFSPSSDIPESAESPENAKENNLMESDDSLMPVFRNLRQAYERTPRSLDKSTRVSQVASTQTPDPEDYLEPTSTQQASVPSHEPVVEVTTEDKHEKTKPVPPKPPVKPPLVAQQRQISLRRNPSTLRQDHAQPPRYDTSKGCKPLARSIEDSGGYAQIHGDMNLAHLTVFDVSIWLERLNLGRFVDRFQQEQVDGALLESIDEQILLDDFGLKQIEALKLRRFVKDGWQPKYE